MATGELVCIICNTVQILFHKVICHFVTTLHASVSTYHFRLYQSLVLLWGDKNLKLLFE